MKGKPYDLLIEHNTDRSQYAFRIRVRQDPPEQLGIILSDAIHQLRATLDNIAFILASRPRGKRAERIQFPIIHPGRKGGRKAFDRWARDRLRGVGEAPLAIIERVQPYHGLRRPRPAFQNWPPYPLSVLNHLSNIDKHRAPHLTFMTPGRFQLEATADPIRREFVSGAVKDNAVVARYWFGEPNVDVKNPDIQMALAVDLPAYRKKGAIPIVEYFGGMLGLIGNDIVIPLRPFLD